MTIGVDLRIFQIGHQYRGIGAHITNLFREFAEMDDLPKFIFFEHPNVDSGLGIIDKYLPKFDYQVRYTNNRLVGETYIEREWASFKQRNITGDAGLGDLTGVDILLSVDFNLGVPKNKFVKTVLISYDMIPWVLSENYLPSFNQTYKKTHSLRRSLKAQLDKRLYFVKFKQANKRASKILAISEHTKKDLIWYLRVSPDKISTVLLGIDRKPEIKKVNKSKIEVRNFDNKQIKLDLLNEKYVFFMGGADRRRRIEDLVSAFDLASTKIPNLKLILAGFDFKDYESIPDQVTKGSIYDSANKDNILFAGFTSTEEKNLLFTHAIAFVFPSIYEGFGLPILEAMDLNCPVITYSNSSIKEVGGSDAVLYAKNSTDISNSIVRLDSSSKLRKELIVYGHEQLKNFSWSKTAQETLSEIQKTL